MAENRKGKYIMREHKTAWRIFMFGRNLILLVLTGLIVYAAAISMTDTNASVTQDIFTENADVHVEESSVGANIWLKQAVHGLNGIKYRYVVKTDCPSWDFETRYVSDKPLDWVDSKAAVEVLIFDTQVRFDGTVFASGQYYTVPILGNLSSESVSHEEWETGLVEQAYSSYVANVQKEKTGTWLSCSVGVLVVILTLFMDVKAKRKEQKDRA